MSQELNATCDICGKKYHVCNSCKEIKSFTPWRTVTDTLQHYAIFLALSQYTKTKYPFESALPAQPAFPGLPPRAASQY